jgi:hypothetical protein
MALSTDKWRLNARFPVLIGVALGVANAAIVPAGVRFRVQEQLSADSWHRSFECFD